MTKLSSAKGPLYLQIKQIIEDRIIHGIYTVGNYIPTEIEFEKEFVTDALPVDLIGMNKEMMCMYIEAVSDRIADLFGFEHVYGTENPFDFMRALDVQNVTNFFEKRVSEYQRPTDRSLSFDESF